jgi:hypothetical protein
LLALLNELPPGLLQAPAAALHEILPGPTLIHLPGARPAPLFVSILLHGNEATGLQAMQRVLADYRHRPLPRALSLFVGNVDAARHGLRRLDHQPDYNRVWPGAEDGGTAEHALMRRVTDEMRARTPFASIDIHNNTGRNPHYACINELAPRFLHLAALFSRTVVYFRRPKGVQSAAFAPLCPAVTVECGQPGSTGADEHAASFVQAALHLSQFPAHPLHERDVDLFHTVATVNIADGIRFGFGTSDADVNFDARLDRMNFCEMSAGTCWGTANPARRVLSVSDEAGRDVSERFFEVRDGRLCLKVALMPSMLTLDETAIRQDCLCYLMERLPHWELP